MDTKKQENLVEQRGKHEQQKHSAEQQAHVQQQQQQKQPPQMEVRGVIDKDRSPHPVHMSKPSGNVMEWVEGDAATQTEGAFWRVG
ncbi:uncharacterized protein VTP21DRAFT_422 [Calcarisporiella thermophila]|uniref:uncharacterized protein n=1 Tax=Calcarisporiella thermophila TaxID=911321 RepID=UPI0037427BC6